MARYDEKLLKAHIKSGEFLPVYLICGNEDYLKKNYVDLICEKSVDGAFSGFNLEKFDGKTALLQDIIEQAMIMPMMSSRKCLVVEDYKLEAISDKELALVENYLMGNTDTAIIIFHQKSEDFSLVKAKKFADLIEKHGAVCVLDKRKGAELIKTLVSFASKQGCSLSKPMADYLISQVGDDHNLLINELHKVCGYASGEITKAHIDAVAVKTDEVKLYYLTKALIQKNFDKAYKVLHTLIRQKVKPEYILGTIIGSYVDMYRGKVALFCGERADAVGEAFGYTSKNIFRLTSGAADASKMELSTLRKCLEVLAEADMKIKMSHEDDMLVLEQLMVKLFLVCNGEKV